MSTTTSEPTTAHEAPKQMSSNITSLLTPPDYEPTEKRDPLRDADEIQPQATDENVSIANPHLQIGWRLVGTLLCLGIGLMFSIMDTSIVATALVTISMDFDDFARSNWVILAYALTYMGFAVTFARLSDVIGRKTAVMVALVIFREPVHPHPLLVRPHPPK